MRRPHLTRLSPQNNLQRPAQQDANLGTRGAAHAAAQLTHRRRRHRRHPRESVGAGAPAAEAIPAATGQGGHRGAGGLGGRGRDGRGVGGEGTARGDGLCGHGGGDQSGHVQRFVLRASAPSSIPSPGFMLQE